MHIISFWISVLRVVNKLTKLFGKWIYTYRQLLYLLMFQSSIEPFTLSICYFQLSNYWINVIVMHFNRIITTNWVIDAEKQAVPSETLISFFCFAVCVFFLALCFLYSIYCLYFLRFSFDYDVVTWFLNWRFLIVPLV